MPHRFPAPWSVHELEQAFVVQDAKGQAVAYVYFQKEENEAPLATLCEVYSSPGGASTERPCVRNGQSELRPNFIAVSGYDGRFTPRHRQ